MRRRNQAEDDTNDNQKEIEEAKRRNSILSCWLFQKVLILIDQTLHYGQT